MYGVAPPGGSETVDAPFGPFELSPMPETSLAYRTVVGVARALLPAAAWASPRLRRAVEARRGALERLEAWGARHRDPARPLVWVHAPSVGEGLQAEAVMQALHLLRPGWQVAYTHFSPSAQALAARVPADIAEYLPFDTREAADRMLRALRPAALVFTKLDLWPELATRAAGHGCRVLLIAATVRPGSGRLGWPARALLAPGYAALDAVAAVDHADAVRLAAIGARPEAIQVLGDPRYDSVAAKVRAVPPTDPLLRFGAGAPTLVAGSTWPGDDQVLLPAFREVRRAHPAARLVLVPHEPTEEHRAGVERLAAELGLPAPVRLSRATAAAELLLVDRLGALAALYGAGTMAYVGGGFQRAGLHSVLEPAAWGVPVLMGPGWTESRDAQALHGAAAAVPITDAAGLAAAWGGWIADGAVRALAGARARAVVDAGLGASARSAELVVRAVERPRG